MAAPAELAAIDPANLTFLPVKRSATGNFLSGIGYAYQNTLDIKLPEMAMPFEVDKWGNIKLNLSTEPDDQLVAKLRGIEKEVKRVASVRCFEWFGKQLADDKENQLDNMFNPFLEWNKAGTYLSLKLKVNDQTVYYDPTKKRTDANVLEPRSLVRVIARPAYVYFMAGKFGVTWLVRQLMVTGSEKRGQEEVVCLFDD